MDQTPTQRRTIVQAESPNSPQTLHSPYLNRNRVVLAPVESPVSFNSSSFVDQSLNVSGSSILRYSPTVSPVPVIYVQPVTPTVVQTVQPAVTQIVCTPEEMARASYVHAVVMEEHRRRYPANYRYRNDDAVRAAVYGQLFNDMEQTRIARMNAQNQTPQNVNAQPRPRTLLTRIAHGLGFHGTNNNNK
jgi:hypothetical protein